MRSIEDKVETLNLHEKIISELKSLKLNYIKDIWSLNRKELKKMGLTDNEIKQIIISLQLEGLDLNKKIYD